ncbi:MAG: hypothetical protein IT249_14835 [Chitinophagaceae bacterium]|nr:hypothetical protein [Chitinophagaceae bacterium]
MRTKTTAIVTKINLNRFGLYFCVLIPLVLLGFWKTYFSKFFGDTNGLTAYMHFHAIVMSCWVALLIVQPILIRRKKLNIHRLLGKVSYVLMPLVLVSMLLLLHSRGNLRPVEQRGFFVTLAAVIGIFVVGFYYLIAIINRKNTPVHARAMICTGLDLLDPTLMRLLAPLYDPWGYYLALAIILGSVLFLMFLERKQKKGRWVFPSLFAILFLEYFLGIFQAETNSINTHALDSLMAWFYSLPLT